MCTLNLNERGKSVVFSVFHVSKAKIVHLDFEDSTEFINYPPSALTQQSKTAECFAKRNVDNRVPVDNFKDSDMHSGIVKLKCYFESDGVIRHAWGTGQIMNMTLDNGKVSRCYIQTAAHNFVQ